jgi:carboxypeptidase C (cathepsin A)
MHPEYAKNPFFIIGESYASHLYHMQVISELRMLNPYDMQEKCERLPLCYDFSNFDKFLNAESTKKALHISHESHRWESCNMGAHSVSIHVYSEHSSSILKET